jgi:HSP20 family protein
MTERQEQFERQRAPVKAYRTENRLTVAAPMPGLQPEDISAEVTGDGRLILRGELRGILKDIKELLISEWSVGGYYRELKLPVAVDGELANVTYDNGVLVVVLPISQEIRAAHLTLEKVGRARGERVGSKGQDIEPTTTTEHLANMAEQYDQEDPTR